VSATSSAGQQGHTTADQRASGERRSHDVPIAILDFGSQYTQLIARRVRERHVYCEILRYDTPRERLRQLGVRGVILSGGPASVLESGAPMPDEALWQGDLPVLGLCYGMEAMTLELGGSIERGHAREYGLARLEVADPSDELLGGLEGGFDAWMSHGDSVTALPAAFRIVGRTADCPFAAARHQQHPLYMLQFHPEVVHTKDQGKILTNFLYTVCGLDASWTMENLRDSAVRDIEAQAPEGGVLCALSGGVDSSVAAVLAHEAVGDRLTCVFVDHGLLREGEAATVTRDLEQRFGITVRHVEAADLFFEQLAGVTDPEEKRKRIGRTFIEVFEREAQGLEDVRYLVQGTLYPDVVESSDVAGPAAVIKSHHNVGGLPETMGLELVEPLRELFKDEVRELGRVLGVPASIIGRHPFPGPGLAVRVLGEVTPEKTAIARQADAIFIEELHARGLYDQVWQAFCVLLPIYTVGVMGDERTYERVIAVRAVTSVDGMTADWARLPADALGRIAGRIVNEVRGVNRVVYDLSSKPPGTIEWE
jgi:GMP synthase (glutamine-hydrolysing)